VFGLSAARKKGMRVVQFKRVIAIAIAGLHQSARAAMARDKGLVTFPSRSTAAAQR